MTSTNTFDGRAGAAEDDGVAVFAAAVRAHLDDLPPDEVEELVDGLEADLIEQRADSGEPLGDPSEYADELRAAAGLPPREPCTADTEWFGGFKRLWRDGSAWVHERRENPVVAAVLDFFVALRPAWWVLRGWVVFAVVFMFGALSPLPTEATGWLLLAGVVVVSVQWGRGRWLPWRWLRVAKVVASVVAVLALPAMLGQARAAVGGTEYDSSPDGGAYVDVAIAGLTSDGVAVTNIFAFDCAGQPLSGVQLYDQDGEPLEVGEPGTDGWQLGVDAEGVEFAIVPNPDTTPGSGWNVVPLSHAEFDESYLPKTSTIEEAIAPFSAVQPLTDADGSCAASRSAGASADDPADTGSDPADANPESNAEPGTDGR